MKLYPDARVVVLAHAKAFAGMHGVVRTVKGRSLFVLLDGDTWPSLLFVDEVIPEDESTLRMVAGE